MPRKQNIVKDHHKVALISGFVAVVLILTLWYITQLNRQPVILPAPVQVVSSSSNNNVSASDPAKTNDVNRMQAAVETAPPTSASQKASLVDEMNARL